MPHLEAILAEHPFLSGLSVQHLTRLARCARDLRVEAGQLLFCEGAAADELFLIRHGRVALEVKLPGRPSVTFATLGEGEVVGASWLVAPYVWMFDARTLDRTCTIGIDAVCLRRHCDTDSDFGYAMMKRFLPVLVKRLHATRMQVLDVYGRR